jgi:GT2 family glycosyltransferase
VHQAVGSHDITVVVITNNRRREALYAVERLLALPERPAVIVVDNGSTDGTSTALGQRFPEVRVIRLGHNLGAVARTIGVENAATAFVAFSDDDSWWEPGSLERASLALRAFPRLALVAGRVVVGHERRLDPTCVAMARSPLKVDTDLPGPAVLGFVACGAVVRRDAYLECGGFSRILGFGGEEGLLALDLVRRGWLLSYVRDVVAHHHPSPVRDERARRRRLARNALWEAWLRRPWSSGMRAAMRVARHGLSDITQLRGLVDAVLGVPLIMRERAVVPAHVEGWLRALETQRARE